MVNKGLPRSYAIQKESLQVNLKSFIYKVAGVIQSVLSQLNKTIT